MISRLPPYVSISALIVSSSLFLTACSSQSFPGSQLLGGQQNAYIPPKLKPLQKITTNTNAQTLWQVSTGVATNGVKLHPYADNNAVYTATGNNVAAWNKQDGKPLWKSTIGGLITGGVNGGDGMVYVGTRNGSGLAIDASTGKTLWIAPLGTEVLSVSESAHGFVVFRTIDGKIHGVKSETGEVTWQRQQRTPQLSTYGASTPIIVSKGVIAGFDNGKIAAYFLATGKPIWEITLSVPKAGSDTDNIVDVDGRLKALGNALFATNANGRIAGTNMNTGQVGWAKAFASNTGTDANSKGVYSTDNKGHVWKMTPETGKAAWKQDDLENRQPTTPTLTASGSHIIVGDQQGNLHWINTSDGKISNRIAADPAGYAVPPTRNNDTIFALGKSGILTAIRSR